MGCHGGPLLRQASPEGGISGLQKTKGCDTDSDHYTILCRVLLDTRDCAIMAQWEYTCLAAVLQRQSVEMEM